MSITGEKLVESLKTLRDGLQQEGTAYLSKLNQTIVTKCKCGSLERWQITELSKFTCTNCGDEIPASKITK